MQTEFASLVEQLPESLRQQLLSKHLWTTSSTTSRADTHVHLPHSHSISSVASKSEEEEIDGVRLYRRSSGGSLSSHSVDKAGQGGGGGGGSGANQVHVHDQSSESRHLHHIDRSSSTFRVKGSTSTATATWDHLHAQDQDSESSSKRSSSRHLATSSFDNNSHAHTGTLKENDNAYQNSYHYRDNDWSSVSALPKPPISPNDQLIAAILDGDVQGVRTIVRSRGDSLLSEYWKDLALSVLPLHRAISGLHFHGSDQKLIHTIETLVQLGASIDAQDHAGNTVLHKAIQVCTSTSVVAVVECVLKKGASPSLRNNMGQCPIHIECNRFENRAEERT